MHIHIYTWYNMGFNRVMSDKIFAKDNPTCTYTHGSTPPMRAFVVVSPSRRICTHRHTFILYICGLYRVLIDLVLDACDKSQLHSISATHHESRARVPRADNSRAIICGCLGGCESGGLCARQSGPASSRFRLIHVHNMCPTNIGTRCARAVPCPPYCCNCTCGLVWPPLRHGFTIRTN